MFKKLRPIYAFSDHIVRNDDRKQSITIQTVYCMAMKKATSLPDLMTVIDDENAVQKASVVGESKLLVGDKVEIRGGGFGALFSGNCKSVMAPAKVEKENVTIFFFGSNFILISRVDFRITDGKVAGSRVWFSDVTMVSAWLNMTPMPKESSDR